MPGLDPMAPPPRRTMSTVAKIFLVLVSLLALLVGVTKPVNPGDAAFMMGERFGFLLVLFFFPLLLAFAFAGWGKLRHPNRFALIFCLVSGIFTLANGVTMLSSFEPPEQRFARLMREAAGVAPESHRGFGRQRKFDDEVRQQYRRLLQQNRDYIAEVKQMDMSKVKLLNSAESYMHPRIEQEGLAQLHALYDVDAGQESKVRGIMADLRHILENYASSSGEREAMVHSFDDSMAAQFAGRQQALASEKAWVDAVDDLHAYAGAHRDAFTQSGGLLIFSDPAVRRQFQAKAEFQDEKRRGFMQLQQQFANSQAQSLGKMGLKPKDVNGK